MPRLGRSGRIAVVGSATLLIAALGTATALALWSSSGSATARSSAGSVPKPGMPTASATDNVVTVTLPAFPNGSILTLRAYKVVRYAVNGAGNVQGSAIGATGSCGAPQAGTATCTETISGPGKWQYAVRFLVGSFWASVESNRSTTVNTTGNGNGNGQATAGQAAIAESTPSDRSTAPALESTPAPTQTAATKAPTTQPDGNSTAPPATQDRKTPTVEQTPPSRATTGG